MLTYHRLSWVATFSACNNSKKHAKGLTSFPQSPTNLLLHKCGSYAVALQNAKNFDAIHHDVPTQLRDLFIGPWQQSTHNPQLPPYLIVIDALDEINFFVTSQPDPNTDRVWLTRQYYTGMGCIRWCRTFCGYGPHQECQLSCNVKGRHADCVWFI